MANNKDVIMGKVQAVASKTMHTTEKLAEQGGRALLKVELKTRLDKLYKQLGELVYVQKKTDTEDDEMVAFYLKEISGVKARLMKLKK